MQTQPTSAELARPDLPVVCRPCPRRVRQLLAGRVPPGLPGWVRCAVTPGADHPADVAFRTGVGGELPGGACA
jgi:hypothetical protein